MVYHCDVLRIDNFVPETVEGVVVEPVSFVFDKGLSVLEPEQKNFFDIASFAFSGIKEGILEIDDLKVDSSLRPLARVLLYRIGIKDFAAVSAIFVMPSKIRETIEKRKQISKGLKELKNKPTESLEEKKEKLASLLDLLEAEGVSYILIDGNNELNNKHYDDIVEVLSTKECTSILLKAKPVEETEEPVEEEADGLKPATSEFKKFMKKESFNFAFDGIFAALAGFTIFANVCLLGGGNVGLGVALLLLAILDSMMLIFVFSSTQEAAVKRGVTPQTYKKIRILIILIYILFYVAGVGLGAILGTNNILFSLGNYWGLALGLSIGLGVLYLLGSIFLNISNIVVRKVLSIFKKKK